MDLNIWIFIILVAIVILIDLIRIKFRINTLEGKSLLLEGGKIMGVGIELITFNFGLSIFSCLNTNPSLCSIKGLNILLASIGLFCFLISIVGYIVVIIKKID